MEAQFAAATALPDADAVSALLQIIETPTTESDSAKLKEQAISKLAAVYSRLGRAEDINALFHNLRPFFATIPKVRTATLVRTLIDCVSRVPDTVTLQTEMCRECIQWCKSENRMLLKQRMEARLAALYLQTQEYTRAIAILDELLREIKRLDDKAFLVEIQLLESRVYHALRNLPKARASLTSGRASANAIYVPPAMQAALDLHSGVLHAEEKDYKTAYSYFFEAFEAYNTLDDPLAVKCLKYMMMAKIMINKPEDISAIVSGKLALRYAGPDVEAMKAVANAYSKRSLALFEQARTQFQQEIERDVLIRNHLENLYETLMEHTLARLIEPFSRVQIAHVAHMIQMPLDIVEAKLSQMILDKRLNGILHQGVGDLIIFDDVDVDKTYEAALGTIANMGDVVDSLYDKSQRLSYN